MNAVATIAAFAGLLLRATADALEAFALSVTLQQERCPEYVPDWIDDGSAL